MWSDDDLTNTSSTLTEPGLFAKHYAKNFTFLLSCDPVTLCNSYQFYPHLQLRKLSFRGRLVRSGTWPTLPQLDTIFKKPPMAAAQLALPQAGRASPV